MLDVERRVDVDAGVEQLLDVLPALARGASRAALVWASSSTRTTAGRAPGARRGRTPRAARRGTRRGAAAGPRDPRAAPRSRRGRGSRRCRRRRRRPRARSSRAALEHGVGLADAGRGAEEDLELAAALALASCGADCAQKRVRVGPAVRSVVIGEGLGDDRYRGLALPATSVVEREVQLAGRSPAARPGSRAARPSTCASTSAATRSLVEAAGARHARRPGRAPPPGRCGGRGRCPRR